MPVTVKKINGKCRVVEAATGKIAKSKTGKAADGGKGSCGTKKAQARAINASLRRSGKI